MRIQFEFSDIALKELDTLREKLNARSRGEVINHALGVLKWLVNEKHNKESRILVERKDSTRSEVVFPQLESIIPDNASE
jgi:hypothetical protein